VEGDLDGKARVVAERHRMKVIAAFAVLVLLLTAGTGVARAQFGCSVDQWVIPADIFEANAQGLPHGLSTAQVVSLFAAAGMAISWSSPASPVEVIDHAMDSGGQGAQVDPAGVASGIRNILKQANGNPVSRTGTARARLLLPGGCTYQQTVFPSGIFEANA
jgi:hypothetical protein